MQDPIAITPRREQPAGVEPRRDLPARAGDGHLPRRHAAARHPHLVAVSSTPTAHRSSTATTVTIDTDATATRCPNRSRRPITGLAKTPRRHLRRRTATCPARRDGPLGAMWNPIYFNYGIAIHGAEQRARWSRRRTAASASRCTSRSDRQELIDKGDQVYVWDGKKEPEQQTARGRAADLGLSRTPTPRPPPRRTTTTTTLAPTTTVARHHHGAHHHRGATTTTTTATRPPRRPWCPTTAATTPVPSAG